jgi:iron complex outermembrane receptor protein
VSTGLEHLHYTKFTHKAQYSFVAGRIQVSGIVNNVSPQARLLGVDQLDAENQ